MRGKLRRSTGMFVTRGGAASLCGFVLLAQFLGCGRTRQERLATGRAAKAGLELVLELEQVPERKGLPAGLTVTNNSDDPNLWRRAVSDAYGRGCVYFIADEDEYQGYFRMGFPTRELAQGESMRIPLDLSRVRKGYQQNDYFRERLGDQRIGALVFLNFDNKSRTNIEILRSDDLASNRAYVDPADFDSQE